MTEKRDVTALSLRVARENLALDHLLYAIEREVRKGNASIDIEDAWDAYEDAMKETDDG